MPVRPPLEQHASGVPDLIIAMERAALDRWGQGDPSGFLEICDTDVVYFDPFLERPIHGLQALTDYYEGIRGKIKIDSDEILNAKVQHWADVAVLTFNFFSQGSEMRGRWNCTEVYRRRDEEWRIVQTHWSLIRPFS